ncbi:MAG: BolA family transcriptional regulator [Gammaproteobacteria bacterium]
MNPQFLRVENESHRHNVPAGAQSHFKVTLVSPRFDGKPLLARHRMVNDLLRDELRGAVHALALHTLTPQEWDAGARAAESPPCLGGSAAGKN